MTEVQLVLLRAPRDTQVTMGLRDWNYVLLKMSIASGTSRSPQEPSWEYGVALAEL